MAKYPAPGRVKTRLAAALGEARACALYRAFVLDLADRLARLPYRVTWAYWPPAADFADLVPGARCRPQQGDDLGARMAHALAAEMGAAPCPVIVIGADAPHLPATSLAEAVDRLRTGSDLVLGPALDGGYYLIGLTSPVPELFAGIAWGTGGVLETTRARATRLGLRTHLLPPTFDVDEPADLVRLAALVATRAVDLPRTATLLASGDAGSS